MSPMALNVPVAMLMSMLGAFTITPWLSFHILTWGTNLKPTLERGSEAGMHDSSPEPSHEEAYDPLVVQQSLLYRFFRIREAAITRNRQLRWGQAWFSVFVSFSLKASNFRLYVRRVGDLFVRQGHTICFAPCVKLVQHMLLAKREYRLPQLLTVRRQLHFRFVLPQRKALPKSTRWKSVPKPH